jgi:uncharacterized protein (TIGR03083 family)
MIAGLTNAEVAGGCIAAYDDFASLIDGLDADAWRTPTRCTGWEVRDVAAHVVGLAADALSGTPGTRTPDEHSTDLRGHAPAELAAQLRESRDVFASFFGGLDDAAWDGASPVPDMSLARGVLGLWFDTHVHADDVRAALGQAPDRGRGLSAAVAFLTYTLTEDGWGPATLKLDGMTPRDIGVGGRLIIGDPYQFVLVATGRAEPASLGVDASINVYRE